MRTKLIFTLAAIIIVVSSCKKTTNQTVTDTTVDTVTAIETPIQSIFTKNKLFDTVFVMNNGSYEIGVKFFASDSGVITKLGVRNPIKSKYAVSLWDVASQALLVTDSISVTDSAKFAYASISPIHISANKAYIVSYNNTVGGTSLDYNISQSKETGDVQYPFSDGHITFLSEDEGYSTTTIFPTDENTQSYLPTVDIVFQAIKK
jgi:hypothetical protein